MSMLNGVRGKNVHEVEHMESDEIGKVVFDSTLNQFAILLDIYRENPSDVWFYRLEYADNTQRDRFYSEIELRPIRHCLVVG